MKKLLRTAALGAIVLAALTTSAVPAGAADAALSSATISSDETVGGEWVRYSASATYYAASPGVATVACSAVAISTWTQRSGTFCWLTDLNTGQNYYPYQFTNLQHSYAAGEFVIANPSRLRLCMYAYGENYFGNGPTRCATLR